LCSACVSSVATRAHSCTVWWIFSIKKYLATLLLLIFFTNDKSSKKKKPSKKQYHTDPVELGDPLEPLAAVLGRNPRHHMRHFGRVAVRHRPVLRVKRTPAFFLRCWLGAAIANLIDRHTTTSAKKKLKTK
jgi:hypothetical protein